MTDNLKIKFWGVRGSHPTPGAGTVKYGGNTSCVEVLAGDKLLILDAGTGIIPLGRDLTRRVAKQKSNQELILLFSHLHNDHTQGFPFFAPAYMPNTKLHIFGPGISTDMLETVLESNQAPTNFPVRLGEMAASKEICSIHENQVIVWDKTGVRVLERGAKIEDDALTVQIHRSYAHPGGVYIYRITWREKSIVYATDTEGYIDSDQRLIRFASNADLLIHDAQYREEHYRGQVEESPTTQGFGHSTVAMACDVANAARVGQLVLFHHDPSYNDDIIENMQVLSQQQRPNTVSAREGLEIVYTAHDILNSPIPLIRSGEKKRDVQYAQHG